MALPGRVSSNRPAYLDNLFREGSHSLNKTPSLRSADSSISSSTASSYTDFRTLHSARRKQPLAIAFEEEDDDRSSTRSLKVQFSPRRGIRNLLNRRTYPQVQEMVDVQFPSKPPPSPAPFASTFFSQDGRPSYRGALRRPSMPQLYFASSSPQLEAHVYLRKPLPAAPSRKAEDLRCMPCYYFAARHCNGYVWGGGHGDACENCLAAGYFGAS